MITLFLRTLLIYILLMVTLRLMGKRQIGELEISELVTTLLLSELAAIPISDTSLPLAFSVIPILLIAAGEFIISDVKNRSPLLKRLFEGEPNVLIRKGKLSEKELKRARISVEELLSACRLQGVGDPKDVYYAILEQNGQLSLLLKKEASPVTCGDASLPVKENGMAHAIIVDGEINEKELSLCGKSAAWAETLCAAYGYPARDVFLFLLDDGDAVTILPKTEKAKK